MKRSSVTHQRWAGLRRVRGALAGAAVGGLMLGIVPADPAAAAGPRLYAVAACTTQEPYRTHFLADGFSPNDQVWLLFRFFGAGSSHYSGQGRFPSDANGHLDLNGGGENFDTEIPHEFGALFFHDRDNSFSYTQGDDVIASLLLTIDKPCTGAVAQPK